MFMLTRYAAWLSGALLAVAAIGSAHAEYVDPPSRVARLSYTRGDVSFSPGGESDWVTATRNRPLIRGDRLWAGRDALAELQAGNATFRVDEGTSLSIINLDDQTAQVEITQGTLNLHVRRIYEGQIFEVDTPTLAFVVSRPGEYRIDVDAKENHTTIAVWDGGGEAYGDKANFRIREGEAIRFYDTRLTDYEAFDIPRPDEFDRFCQDRNDAMDRSASRRYVSEDLIGYSDLDEYGSWTTESDYGAVWYPTRVAADWAPYRDGHWIWQEPWGWTWVDDSAWGFAPFHYGRWAHVRNRWGWIPGPIASRPVYAPALVAFVGGHNWSVGINVGRPIGWFPLGPREIYVPPYRSSRNYFTSVNVTNTVINNTYITNVYNDYSSGRNVTSQINYFNRGVNGAVTAVSTDTFVNSRGVRGAQVRFDRDMAMRGETSQIATIAPVNRSVLGSGRAASAVPQREVFDRAVVARTAPPRSVVPFSERQQALQRTPGRALTPDAVSTIQQRDRTANASVPQRVRVIDDNAVRNARTIDAEPGSRGGAPSRSRGPDDGASNPPGRVATDRGAPTRDRGEAPGREAMPNREAPTRDRGEAPGREAMPNREAPNREATPNRESRDRGAAPAERDFTRPNVRDRGEPAVRREPIRDTPNPRESVQREAPAQVDRSQRDGAQREQIQREREDAQRGREQMQRDQQAQREQVQRQREDEQRGREQMQRDQQAQREQVQRQREDEQRGREQQREQQAQREQVQRQREDQQRDREQQQREQQAQREQIQRQREDQQREQQAQREQVQRQREDEQRGREQQQREQQQAQREQQQRDQAQQREQMQMQREQQANQQREQAQRQQAQQREQMQREQAPPREARQREAPPQRDQAPARRSRDDGDDKRGDDRR